MAIPPPPPFPSAKTAILATSLPSLPFVAGKPLPMLERSLRPIATTEKRFWSSFDAYPMSVEWYPLSRHSVTARLSIIQRPVCNTQRRTPHAACRINSPRPIRGPQGSAPWLTPAVNISALVGSSGQLIGQISAPWAFVYCTYIINKIKHEYSPQAL